MVASKTSGTRRTERKIDNVGKNPSKTVSPKVDRPNPVEAYLVCTHGGVELTVIVTTTIEEALRQAREEDTVREAIRRDGGVCIYRLRD